MQSLGIFGDSFANDYSALWHRIVHDPRFLNMCKDINRQKIRDEAPHWCDLLTGYAPSLHGVGGSDIYTSFCAFMKYHHDYSRIIFVITCPRRYSVWTATNKGYHNIDLNTGKAHTDWAHSVNGEEARRKGKIAKQDGNIVLENVYNGLSVCHDTLFPYDYERGNIFTSLVIDKVKSIRPDTLFVNAFPWMGDVFGNTIVEHANTLPLNNIKFIEDAKNKKHQAYINDIFCDFRIAHHTTETHQLLAVHVQEHLDNHANLLQLTEPPQFVSLEYDEDRYFCGPSDEEFINYLDKYGYLR